MLIFFQKVQLRLEKYFTTHKIFFTTIGKGSYWIIFESLKIHDLHCFTYDLNSLNYIFVSFCVIHHPERKCLMPNEFCSHKDG